MTDVEKLLVRIGTARDAISRKTEQTSLDYMIDGVLMNCSVLLKEQQKQIEQMNFIYGFVYGGQVKEIKALVRCKDCAKWDKSTMEHYDDVISGSGDTAECRMFCDMDSWGEFTDDMRRTDGNWYCADGEART